MYLAHCSECEALLTLKDDVRKGEIVTCVECSASLEVLSDPPNVTLGLAPEEEEDWGE